MDLRMEFLIWNLCFGVYHVIRAVVCRYAPAFAVGKRRWYGIRPEYKKDYIKYEIQTCLAISVFCFLMGLELFFDRNMNYFLDTVIVLFILLLGYVYKMKKRLPQ